MNTRNFETLAAFRHQVRKFLRFSKDLVGAEGLTTDQYQALLAVRAHSGSAKFSIRDLADQLQIRHHSTVGIVDQLVRHGAIVREIASDDRRKVLLSLTPRGLELVERLAPAHQCELVRLCPEIIQTLNRLCDEFQNAASPDGSLPGGSAHPVHAAEKVGK